MLKVKSLELELSVAREQIDRAYTSKLGFVENGSTTVVNHPNFSLATSSSGVHQTLFEVKVHKEVVHASRRTRVDLSESKTKNSNQSESKKNHKPQWFCHFCGRAGHTRPNYFKLQALKKSPKKKVYVPKAQDPIAIIHELVKVLNLYTNPGTKIRTNPNSKFASKRV